MEHLQNFIGDCDRKTEMAKRRLKETQEELSEEANAKVITILCTCWHHEGLRPGKINSMTYCSLLMLRAVACKDLNCAQLYQVV